MHSILITNDDGIESPSLQLLKDLLGELGEITIVAPKTEKSWCGKEISRFGEFIVEECGDLKYSVTGTPADCILLGIFHILDKRPNLVISGINAGANAGNSFILSSGTVGAAIEAALLGIPSIAVSILIPNKDLKNIKPTDVDVKYFSTAAEITKKITKRILEVDPEELPSNLYIINVPFKANRETKIKITSVGEAHYGSIFRELIEKAENSKRIFKFGVKDTKGAKFSIKNKGSDIHTLLVERSISITPISLNLTGNIEKTEEFFKSILE